jgi:L-lysine exporter family protein LysE/ArgO
MLSNYLLSAFFLGIIVAIPPGAVTVIACQRALQYGFKNSLLFTTGSCISDILYIILVYYGLTGFVYNGNYKIILWVVCGLLLILIGVTTISATYRNNMGDRNSRALTQSKPLFTFMSGIFITLTNPLTIIGWIAIAGNFFLIWNSKYPTLKNYSAITIIIIMIGVLVWFIPLTFVVSRLKKAINTKLQKHLVAFSGICLVVFGCISIYSALKLL